MYGILTFHRALNAGAVLQCYALQRFMNGLGIPNAVVDYRNAFIERQHHPFRLYRDSIIKCAARAAVLGFVLRERVKRFDAFVAANIKTSKPYAAAAELSAGAGGYAGFITGSDQVFSADCAAFDPVYFLAFPGAEGKRFSYAASFGGGELDGRLRDEYTARLAVFPFLSLRESGGAALVRGLLPDMPAETHIDPVLLLPRGEWERLAVPPKEKDYVLLYTMLPSGAIHAKAAALGKQLGLPVLWPDDKYYQRRAGVKHRLAVGPGELLGYIAGARHVVTNSFHGTAFSLLFEKDFTVEAGHAKSSRLTSLLALLGVDNTEAVDWPAVRAALERERARSASYLKRICAAE
jgi:hypothetical protein